MAEVPPQTLDELTLYYGLEMLRNLKGEAASKTIFKGTDRETIVDPYWFRAQYVLGAFEANSQIAELNSGRHLGARFDNLFAASRSAVRLTSELVKYIDNAYAIPTGTRNDGFWKFLSDIQGPALVMWAGVINIDRVVSQLSPGESAELPRLSMLRGTDLKPDSVVRFVETTLKVTAKTRYNLACYYAVAGFLASLSGDDLALRHFGRALLELRFALDGLGPNTREWAKRDPCFAGLTGSEFRDDFFKLVGTAKQARRRPS